jgi:GTPase
MALIDELRFHAKGGDGGDGVVRWLHMKGKEYGGPSGGNGGKGGDIYAQAVSDISILARYSGEKVFRAGRGEDGQNRSRHGKGGEDLTIEVPTGSVIRNLVTGEEFDLSENGQRVMLLSGGRGGAGNEHFKSSVNQRPEEAQPGQPGQEADFLLELRLVADAGLIGLPNAGKSSLLNTLTNAKAAVGAYAFTTLDPNLGAMYGFIVADIPGLIEGASAGKGLGYKFLRHITRTRALFHCISLESEDPVRDYETVRRELVAYDEELSRKPEIVILTKADARTPEEIAAIETRFEAQGRVTLSVTILDDDSVKSLRDSLVAYLKDAA